MTKVDKHTACELSQNTLFLHHLLVMLSLPPFLPLHQINALFKNRAARFGFLFMPGTARDLFKRSGLQFPRDRTPPRVEGGGGGDSGGGGSGGVGGGGVGGAG